MGGNFWPHPSMAGGSADEPFIEPSADERVNKGVGPSGASLMPYQDRCVHCDRPIFLYDIEVDPSEPVRWAHVDMTFDNRELMTLRGQKFHEAELKIVLPWAPAPPDRKFLS